MSKAPVKALPKHSANAARLQFHDIGNDCIILKDGSARAVIEVTPISLAGYTDEEQRRLMARYAEFLNTLEAPIQILYKSRTLDMQGYLDGMKAREESEQRPFFRGVLKDYRGLLEKFLPYSGYGVMQRSIYLVVAFEMHAKPAGPDPLAGVINLFAGHSAAREARKLAERTAQVRAGLDLEAEKVLTAFAKIGLPVRRLPTVELIRLFAHVYHPSSHDAEHEALFAQFDAPA
jgi:hypothetical protein